MRSVKISTFNRADRAGILGLLIVCIASGGCVRDATLQRFEFRARKMGTEARIVLYAPSESIAVEATRAAFARIETIDSLLSDYRASSEVARLAAQPPGSRARVSEELTTVMNAALSVSRATDGAFDVTVGPLTQLWREARSRKTIPNPAAICAALSSIGWNHVTLDAGHRSITFQRAGMRLDFGGIAKGYAADEAMRVMRANGVTRALLEFGGEIAANDAPPGEPGWMIAVEGEAEPFVLQNGVLSTSGDREQFVEVGGVRYSHVIDPRTGAALTSRAQVTVFAAEGMLADALATSATVLDSAATQRLVAAHSSARLVSRNAVLPSAAGGCRAGRAHP